MNVLVVNAGSSTVKLSLVGARDETLSAVELDAPHATLDRDALRTAIDDHELWRADVTGHRVVHGGERFRSAVLVDASVEAQLRQLVDLAPLHQPKSIEALDAVGSALPGIPAVACFDTAFHSSLPPEAYVYALPAEWRSRWGLRRYGFHGLSHAYVARRTVALVGDAGSSEAGGLRIVSCHLGAGASLCAIAGGRSIDTTMGFTPLEGLVMATRSGNVDPGMMLWLLERIGMSARELARALEHASGVLGLSGTADMREVLARADAGDGDASLALAVYVHRLRQGIGAMAAALDGLDVLVFTGGVGERSAPVRSLACAGLAFLGVAIDEGLNASVAGADGVVSPPGARVQTLVVQAREDLEIARQARVVVGS